MKRPFAVFDIDGTIARTTLLQQIVRVMVNRGKLDIGPAQQIEDLQVRVVSPLDLVQEIEE